MISFDLNSYHPLFIKNARDCLNNLRSNLAGYLSLDPQTKSQHAFEMFRMAHMLKGQSAFMGYPNTAQYCLILEKIFRLIQEKNLILKEDQMTELSQALDILTKDLTQIEAEKKEASLEENIKQLNQVYTNQYEIFNR